ncbi:MAG: sensor histidine kinase [Haloplanus sp.]
MPVNLSALVRDRLDELRRSTDSVTVETDIDETYVEANELLASVVDNLLRNAVEHGSTSNRTGSDNAVEHGSTSNRTESGNAWLRVTVTPTDRGDAVQFRIEDDGPGFTDAELAIHGDGRATESALQHSDGVGLWLVRWIVDAYDGRVDIGNAADGGAVVTVTLSRADGPNPNPSASESTPSVAEDAELAQSR